MIAQIVALLLAGPPAPEAAGAAASASPPAREATVSSMVVQAEKKPKPDDMVCKKEAVLGSRMPKRTCMVRADWKERQQEDRSSVERNQTNLQGFR